MQPIATEVIHANALHSRLRAMSAVYRADKTADPNRAHIYYSAPARRWLLVMRRRDGAVVITHWATCPCALTQVAAR